MGERQWLINSKATGRKYAAYAVAMAGPIGAMNATSAAAPASAENAFAPNAKSSDAAATAPALNPPPDTPATAKEGRDMHHNERTALSHIVQSRLPDCIRAAALDRLKALYAKETKA